MWLLNPLQKKKRKISLKSPKKSVFIQVNLFKCSKRVLFNIRMGDWTSQIGCWQFQVFESEFGWDYGIQLLKTKTLSN